MNVKICGFLATTLVLLCSAWCFPQTASREQEIESRTSRAQRFIQEKRPDLAIPELEAITATDPRNLNAQANLGVLLYFQGDYAKAEVHLHAAIDLQSGLTRIQGLLGIAEKRLGEATKARADLETSFRSLQVGMFKTQVGMELIELYTAGGELELAAEIVGQMRRAEPENLEVQYSAYRIYSDLAGDSMLTLSLVAPDSAQLHQIMAQEASKRGNTNDAIAQERAAIRINPHLPGVHLELGAILSASGNSKEEDEAEQEYLAALKENRFDERAECGLGKVYARKGDYTKALTHYSAATTLQPNDAEANSGMAQTLIEMDQPSKALPFLEKAVKLEPTEAADHYRLSRLYRQQQRTEEAKSEMALYMKYKAMKERLRTIYKDLRLPLIQAEPDDVGEKIR
jgi:tetratricopeptide (TPR) repeat protein